MDRYDIAVVGLGPIGAGVLRHAAASGARTIGVGVPEPPVFAEHGGPFASHYDSGRVTRHLDATWEWAELARRAIVSYPTMEAKSGIAFHRPVGLIYAASEAAEVAGIEGTAARLAGLGIAVQRVDDVDGRVAIDPAAVRYVEPGPAGHVDPRRMVAAQVACARADGADVVATTVVAVATTATGWRLHLASGAVLDAATVVVAGGPHADEIDGLPPLPPMTVRAEAVVTGVVDAAEQARLAGLPSVLAPVDDVVFDDVYLVPPTDYPDGTMRIKLGATRRTKIVVPDAPSRRAWMRGDDHRRDLDALRRLTEALVPGLQVVRWETKPCLITGTPTGLPYVDHVADGLVLAAGCNGYAGKSGDAIGALAASLALEGRWTDVGLDRARFAVAR